MKSLKKLLFKRFNQIFYLNISMAFSLVILMLRMKIHQEFYFLFLVWNLFLAIIPYAITTYLISKPKLNRVLLILWFGAWLAFLPNAPYIVTDLIHLKITDGSLLWLDVILISSFAINGLVLFLLSLSDMKFILRPYLHQRILNYFVPTITFLTGFGIYLGRFLRYNSWEIIQNPFQLAGDIMHIIFRPGQNTEAWIFTFSFSIFLYTLCMMFILKPKLLSDKHIK